MKPTPEQIKEWFDIAIPNAKRLPINDQEMRLASMIYQAGRESMIEELRAGGVELPDEWLLTPDGKQVYTEAQMCEYGDRRAAAADAFRQVECDIITDRNHGLWLALENCRMLAQRYKKEDWAQNIMRFCSEGGSTPNILRDTEDQP